MRRSIGGGTIQANVEGGTGVDTVTMLLDGLWRSGSKGLFSFDLGGGSDSVTAALARDVAGDAFGINAGGELALRARGGTGNDALRVATTGTTAGFVDGVLRVDLRGGLGNEIIGVDLRVDMFGGRVQLAADGGPGSDSIGVNFDSSPSVGSATHDLAVSGGDGNDLVSWTQTNAGTVGFVRPNVLDGGIGTLDSCAAGGVDAPRTRGCER